jgi:hypothetical protein
MQARELSIRFSKDRTEAWMVATRREQIRPRKLLIRASPGSWYDKSDLRETMLLCKTRVRDEIAACCGKLPIM